MTEGGGRRVLIISRELPPSVGPHAIRVAKLTKYLPAFGWQPSVLTVPLDHAWALDETLVHDLGDTPVFRVPRLFRRLIPPTFSDGRPIAGSATGALGPPARTLRGTVRRVASELAVPDRDLLWAVPAARAAAPVSKRLDVILTTAPPFSTHLIGARISRRTGVPWVAEYRDNWTMNPLYARGPVRRRMERSMERRALERAAAVVAISEAAAGEIAAVFPEIANRIFVAMNGFDPDDLPAYAGSPSRFEITYTGTLDHRRDPRQLLAALSARVGVDSRFAVDLRLRLIGNVAPWIGDVAREALGADRVRLDGLVPHREALEAAAGSAVLLGITTREEAGGAGLTSKLFEYLGLRRPILMLAPDGPARALVTHLGAGETADPEDLTGISAAVDLLYDRWRSGSERIVQADDLEPFTRRETARLVAAALEAAIGEHSRG